MFDRTLPGLPSTSRGDTPQPSVPTARLVHVFESEGEPECESESAVRTALAAVRAMTTTLQATGAAVGPEERADRLAGLRQIVDLAEAACDVRSGPRRGLISFEHVRTIHRTARAPPPSSRPEGVATLTSLAPQLGVDDLRSAGRHLQHVVDPDGSARHAEEDFGRRWHPLPAARRHELDRRRPRRRVRRRTLRRARPLPGAERPGRRSHCRPTADGLAEVVAGAARSGELPTLAGSTVALQVAVSLGTLTGQDRHPVALAGRSGPTVWLTRRTPTPITWHARGQARSRARCRLAQDA